MVAASHQPEDPDALPMCNTWQPRRLTTDPGRVDCVACLQAMAARGNAGLTPAEARRGTATRVRAALQERLHAQLGHLWPPGPNPDGETLLDGLMGHLDIDIIDTRADRTWIWSDLHLDDEVAYNLWRRPYFESVERVNDRLLREWKSRVEPGDTIICLGDIATAAGWRNTHLGMRLKSCPGTRWLVLGNHDVHHLTPLQTAGGFEKLTAAAVYASDPPLILTHTPLRQIPEGTVNVHGHTHAQVVRPTDHINVCVERTGYRPRVMSAVVEQARRLVGRATEAP